MEDIRVEILGSLKYEGVASNLKAKFENKCKSILLLEEEKEELLEPALEAWLRQLLLRDKLSTTQSKIIKPWKKSLNEKELQFKKEFLESLEDQIGFSETARRLLHELGIDKEDKEKEEDQDSVIIVESGDEQSPQLSRKVLPPSQAAIDLDTS